MTSVSDPAEFTDSLLEQLSNFAPEVAVLLGSGLGQISEQLDCAVRIPYEELSGFPARQVDGHRGELLAGNLYGRRVLLFNGRFHVYQGLTPFEAVAPIRLAAACGCERVLLTCAVGGIDAQLRPGDFVLVSDHLNFSGLSPLQGLTPPRFVDLHACYSIEAYPLLEEVVSRHSCSLYRGVLAYMPGPQYETPAEISALRNLGASVVGMSAVLEAIMARGYGLDVTALALVTNLAAGCTAGPLSHSEVLDTASTSARVFRQLIEALLS